MSITRRRFMRTLAAGTISSTFGIPLLAQGSPLNTLKIPPLYAGEAAGGQQHYALTTQTGSVNFIPGLRTPTIGVNGDFLGPTLHLKNGDNVSIAVKNLLGETTTVHWHGLHLPAKADGGPAQVIENGTTWNPQFQVNQKAGSFWYHSHLLGKTGEQVYRGLVGMIIIEDEESSNLELPSTYGVDDIPLVVQDRRFNEDGTFRYVGMGMMDVMMGVLGNTILVNGTSSAQFSPSTNRVRFRLLNGANARTFNFAFEDNREFQLIASDGGFLEKPVNIRNLELAPAERAEIVVNFSNGNPVRLMSYPIANDSPYAMQGMMRNMMGMNNDTFEILTIEPQSRLETRNEIPTQLTTIRRMNETEATRIRRFTLSMPMGMGMMNGRGGPAQGRGPGGMMGGMAGGFQINGKSMDMSTINERVTLGDTEIWEIKNDSMMTHPFHIHQGQFQILDRDGVAPPPSEQGFKDVMRVGPGQVARFIMRFDHFSDPETAYMYHCHILEHEDNGMMGQFTVS